MNYGRLLALACLVLLLSPGVSGSDRPQGFLSPIGSGSGGPNPWAQLSPAGGGEIFPWGDDLVVSFSGGRGLWLYAMSEWSSLTPANPSALVVHCDGVFATFAEQGFWRYDRVSGWSNLTSWEPIHLVPNGDSLLVDFGAAGLWRYDCPLLGLTAGFFSDQPSPGPNTVSMAEGSSEGSFVTIDVNVTQTSGVFGAAFDVVFDSAAVSYVSSSAGELLEQGGVSVFYAVAETDPGRLVVGAARQGTANATDAVGTVAVIRLTFQALQAGMSTLRFEDRGLVGEQGGLLGGISWFGGTLVAN